jgi:hypothetical protein
MKWYMACPGVSRLTGRQYTLNASQVKKTTFFGCVPPTQGIWALGMYSIG